MANPSNVRKIKKGELLFNEGDPSKAMYFVQSGTIRLFKKKGSSAVELGLIHRGEVIGEMGFLDGGARSASAEAIHDTELTEITNASLAEQLKTLPPWLMVLLKTIVNRLRSANNKIRQLESASTAYTYGSEGVSTTYQFLSMYDVLKVCSAVLLVATRNGEENQNGIVRCSIARINRYANQIMGIHISKITEMIDILERVGLAKIDRKIVDKAELYLNDLDLVETLITFLNDENLKEHSKKVVFSIKAVILMGYIVKYLDKFPPNAEGISEVNLAKIVETEKAQNGGKEPFRYDETINELVKVKLATDLALKDGNTVLTQIKARELIRMFRIQKIIKEIELINEKKREQAGGGSRASSR